MQFFSGTNDKLHTEQCHLLIMHKNRWTLDAGFWLSHMTCAYYSINLRIILSLFILFFRPVDIIIILTGNTSGLSQGTC